MSITQKLQNNTEMIMRWYVVEQRQERLLLRMI